MTFRPWPIIRSISALSVAILSCAYTPTVFAAPLKGGVEQVAPLESEAETGSPGDSLSGQLDSLSDKLDALSGMVDHRRGAPLSGQVDGSGSLPLTGKMEFSEKVAPVDPAFKPHKLFAAENLPKEDSEDGWYKIPAWRAGRFHRDTQTNHTIFGDVTINSAVDHVYGMQVDKNGGIWHHESWPKITKVELNDYTEYKIIHKYEPVLIGKNDFVIKTFETDIDVDKKTGKIRQVSKQESYIKYRPCGPDVACANCTTQGFSQYGRVNTTVERSTLEEVRTDPFRVVNVFRGVNLRESFKKFLKAKGLEHLDPDS